MCASSVPKLALAALFRYGNSAPDSV